MSGLAESTALQVKREIKEEEFDERAPLPLPVKREIKEEEFDDFLQEYLSATQEVEEKPGLEHDCKTEMPASSTSVFQEENFSATEVKEEEEYNLGEHGSDDSSPSSKFY